MTASAEAVTRALRRIASSSLNRDGAKPVMVTAAVMAIILTSSGIATAMPALSKPAFVARGNAICEDYYRRLNRVPAPAKTAMAIAAYERRVLPLGIAELKQLEAITPPAADRRTYRQWLAVARQEAGVARKMIAAGDQNDAVAVNQLIARGGALDRSYDALAGKLDLSICAQPTSKTK